VLERIFVGRSGQLENTVFAMLEPDGKTLLASPGRSPQNVFGDSAYLAEAMDYYVSPYLNKPWGRRSLPKVESYRLALNIAACDGLPVVLLDSEWERRLSQMAWDESLLGQAVFVLEPTAKGAVIVAPDQFGLKGEPVQRLTTDMDAPTIARWLKSYQTPPKDTRTHISDGERQGIRWQTAVPVTDPAGRY
jgi:hypothetical protein